MADDHDTSNDSRVSRKRFLGQVGAASVALGLAGCGGAGSEDGAVPAADIDAAAFGPLPPSQRLVCDTGRFLTDDEARTVEAFVARLVPGSVDDPGAIEACVPTYIDAKLAQFATFATPTYFHAPFAKPTTASVPPDQKSDETLLVAKADAYRYGFQSSQTPRAAYRAGLVQLDTYTRQRYGLRFFELTGAQQDAVITLLQSNDPEGPPATLNAAQVKAIGKVFVKPSAFGFFSMLQNDTNEGMFADPMYGGNAEFAGWKLIGYPGAQRAWTPEELRSGPLPRRVQGLRQLPPMNPGHPAHGAILPIAGSERS
jgi:gluconate 2-dehydrogenase gamma chain